ncbi:hypothetical protein Pan189_09590 [Stratiformator vulcanicus]|uniref:Uncharacterized protein n=1 Tax=Stratiformator vulcanicus TaxID=2527980 RepID=A0A517QY66_9PLAN|nr:hypothetical protein Pan189_09590 [Stratiformator vulcanicus]
MTLLDGRGLPLAIDTDSASRNDVKLIEPLLDKTVLTY